VDASFWVTSWRDFENEISMTVVAAQQKELRAIQHCARGNRKKTFGRAGQIVGEFKRFAHPSSNLLTGLQMWPLR
jgi:hypothetical protein